MKNKHSAGKGDTYRRVDLKQYSKNYDLIFKKGKKNERSKVGRSRNRRTSNNKG